MINFKKSQQHTPTEKLWSLCYKGRKEILMVFDKKETKWNVDEYTNTLDTFFPQLNDIIKYLDSIGEKYTIEDLSNTQTI